MAFVNAARSRFFQLSLPGHKFARIGGDGGFVEAPIETDMPAPHAGRTGRRLDRPDRGRRAATSSCAGYPTTAATERRFSVPAEDVLTLHLDAAPAVTPAPLPASLRTIQPIDTSGATKTDIVLTVTSVDAGLDGGGGLEVNGKMFDTMVMAKSARRASGPSTTGPTGTIRGTSTGSSSSRSMTAVQPVHKMEGHVQRADEEDQALRRCYEDRPGNWMFHCHILEHAELGMMGMLMLEP